MSRHPCPWLLVRENEAAWLAVARVVDCIQQGSKRRSINPLFLHGASGTGKTRLLHHLRDQVGGRFWPTGDELFPPPAEWPGLSLDASGGTTPVVLIDDLHRLGPRTEASLIALVDHCLSRSQQLVVAAPVGPALLSHLSRRLTSRLSSGLVVGLQPLGPASRRAYLLQAFSLRQGTLRDDVLNFLVAQLPGSFRALEGALNLLETLGPQPSLAAVQALLAADSPEPSPSQTLERIIARVCDYFQVPAREVRSARRSREVIVPRQVSMYLARQFTGLSLVAIGEQLGGRDHSTVLHACHKIEEELQTDANLCRAVGELAAGLAAGR
ncbi:MAG: helix-turn-helix domain-containing protein [Gemmataceae bacterium]